MKTTRILNIIVVLVLSLSLAAQAQSAANSNTRVRPITDNGTSSSTQGSQALPQTQPLYPNSPTGSEEALKVIDPELREVAQAGGSQLIKVSALVEPGTDISGYFDRYILRPGSEFDRVIGLAPASMLIKIASKRGTLAVLTMEKHATPDINQPVTEAESGSTVERIRQDLTGVEPVSNRLAVSDKSPESINAPTSFFTQDTNGVKQTWAMGITGDGDPTDVIKLAIIDTGVDFANPDLFDTQARVTSLTSKYYDANGKVGWPIAFDDRSMSDYALDVRDYRGNWGWYMNTDITVTVYLTTGMPKVYFGQFDDPDLHSTDPFTFTVTHPDLEATTVYTVTAGVQQYNKNGGHYRIGWHPDDSLADVLKETPAVLLSGENFHGTNWGVFDTIYVDAAVQIEPDKAGTDHVFDGIHDAWATLGWETGWWNLPGFGSVFTHGDLSAGMIYYIANGTTPIPASDWLYGLGTPASGSVVAFMLNDFSERGGDHGTKCAGTAVGQGIIDEMPYGWDSTSPCHTYGCPNWPPAWYTPTLEGGISQGPGQQTKLVAMGNYYQGGSSLNFYDFAALGYDGIPAGAEGDNDDQPQITSSSYGNGTVNNDGWDLNSRYINLINHGYIAQQDVNLPEGGAYSPLFVKSAGNSGFGYGTVNTPGSPTEVVVGIDTVFGQFNFGDYAISRDWVNWGDLAGFSDRGPTAMSTISPHVLANGFFGSGNLPLNSLTGGDRAVDYWSGSSRSAPEVAGILALIYDAYYQKNGAYPSWKEARTLLMNGARTIYNDPFAQGAGLANAFNSVEIITGTRGVAIESSEGDGFWTSGDFRGTAYDGFGRGLFPGEKDTETFTVTNLGSNPVTVDLEPVTLELYHTREWDFTSLPLEEEAVPITQTARYYDRRLYGLPDSNPGFGGDDPLFLSDNLTDTQLLEDADLMVIRLSYPLAQYKVANGGPGNTGDNWWILYTWAWRDTDLNGTWFHDDNSNRIRNNNETVSPSELVRINYNYAGNNTEIRIREPWARLQGQVGPNEPLLAAMTDVLISLSHYGYGFADTTDLKITVELYKEDAWNELELGVNSATFAPDSTTTFTATTTATEPPGEYTGYIKAAYTDPYTYTEYVPVTKQVWFPSEVDPILGGVDQPTLYNNGVMFGGTGPSISGMGSEAGDWRFFYTDVPENPPLGIGTYLLAHTTWQSTATPPAATDIDTLFFGPAPHNAWFDDFSALFGPSGLEVIGGSLRTGSAPNWKYDTSSGGPEDWSSARIADAGLYGVAAHTVLWGGETTRVPYTITTGTAQASPYVVLGGAIGLSDTFTITFKTNHTDLEDEGLEAQGYGFTQPVDKMLSVLQGESTYYPYTIVATDTYRLQISTYNTDSNVDTDLNVYRRSGTKWVLVGSSGRSDSNEQVILINPPAGDYRIELVGYAIPGGIKDVSLSVLEVSGLGAMSVSGLPASIEPGITYPLNVTFNKVPDWGDWYGVIFLGPQGSPKAIEIPVFISSHPIFLPTISK